MSALLNASDADAALEQLHELRCTDGLPVIIPSLERVARMVLASGLDSDIELGVMGPGYGVASVEKVAVAAVMAGCKPDYMPLVVAAVRALCQPEFDLTEMQCTTHCTAPMLVINGPARTAAGLASGFGLMGPGHRANASIGRAVRLTMINIGGARAGESDMAIHGSPAKFGLCFAEDEEASPFPPLHTALGYAADESVVTIVGVEGPHSVLYTGDTHDVECAAALLDVIAGTIANCGSNNSYLGGCGAVAVVLNPEHADILHSVGFTRPQIQAELAARAVTPRGTLARINPKMLRGDEDMIPAVRDAGKILVMVAGAPGLYSMVMPSWCAGPHGNVAVHAAVELNQFCELPGAAGG